MYVIITLWSYLLLTINPESNDLYNRPHALCFKYIVKLQSYVILFTRHLHTDFFSCAL